MHTRIHKDKPFEVKFVENYIYGSDVPWGMLLSWAHFLCLPQKAIIPTVTMVCTGSTEEGTNPMSSSRECSQKAYAITAFCPWDSSRWIPCLCEAHENNKPICHTCLCSSSIASLTHKPKGSAGEAEAHAVPKSKPLYSIPEACSLIPLCQGHLGCKGGLSLIKPVLSRDISYYPPKKCWDLQQVKPMSIYEMKTESKELKSPCGTSCMCCACRNPWVFYTEMLIIIIVLEHLYLPKHLPCTCSPAMEREQWERTEAAAAKGRKIVTFSEQLHQFFFKQYFLGLCVGKNEHGSFTVFLLTYISNLVKGISALQFFEELKWKDRSWEDGIFSLSGWAGTGLAVLRHAFFPSLQLEHVYWHSGISWELTWLTPLQFKV